MSHKLTKRHLRSIKRMMEHKGQHELRKDEKAQRRLARAQRDERPPRQRDWLDGAEAAPSYEKIRRARTAAPLRPTPGSALDGPPGEAGTVIEVRSGDSLVAVGGRVVRGILTTGLKLGDPRTRSPLAVGDRVVLEPSGHGEARIAGVLPRRSALRRSVYDASRHTAAYKGQVIAANIDLAVIVCSPAAPPFRPRLIDRYLVAASLDALPALVCMNKCDLEVPADVERYLNGYARLGIDVVRTSAVSRAGLVTLTDQVAGRVSLFTGHSGVGKSSLLNAVEPGLALRVGEVTQAAAGQGKGRHTTSSARLVPLSLPDTFVVDSPGIRSFGIRGLAPRGLAAHFPDIDGLAGDCAYRDCLHRGEAGCAVESSAAQDWFLRARLESYRTLLTEVS
jgi:ribosome biogenesis GTPase